MKSSKILKIFCLLEETYIINPSDLATLCIWYMAFSITVTIPKIILKTDYGGMGQEM